jgi:hypothetical protein
MKKKEKKKISVEKEIEGEEVKYVGLDIRAVASLVQ